MNVLLFYLAKPKYGGWPTYTAHLHRGLRELGYNPIVVKVGNKTENKYRNFGRKINYRNVCIEDLSELANKYPSIITAIDKTFYEPAMRLFEVGVPLVIHDPTELKAGIKESLPENIIVIRESMLNHLPMAQYFPHPYARRKNNPVKKNKQAVTTSRVDFDKHTEIICEANTLLIEPIDIYGFQNRMYAHFKLDEQYPNWESAYRGQFDAEDLYSGMRIAENYHNVVDLSQIKGDGGGTQYTFLEAANAGSNLILHAGWNPQGLLADYATTITKATELVSAVEKPSLPSESAELLLQHHDAKTIAAGYVEYLGWPKALQ
jgi:hypothetical protein